jgi:hypothetical protein
MEGNDGTVKAEIIIGNSYIERIGCLLMKRGESEPSQLA